MQTFPFWGHTIEITDSMIRTGEIGREIEKARASTATVAQNYKYTYNEYSSLTTAVDDKCFGYALDEYRGPIIDLYTQKLNQEGYRISGQEFKEKYVVPNTRFPASYYALQKEVARRVQVEDARRKKSGENVTAAARYGDDDQFAGAKMGHAVGNFLADMGSESLLSLKMDYPNSRDVLVDAIVEGMACVHTAYTIAYNDLSGTEYYMLKQEYETPDDNLIRQEGFPHIRVGARIVIPADLFHEWLTEQAGKGGALVGA